MHGHSLILYTANMLHNQHKDATKYTWLMVTGRGSGNWLNVVKITLWPINSKDIIYTLMHARTHKKTHTFFLLSVPLP